MHYDNNDKSKLTRS